ncbi:MAG: hypothetical protein R3B06_07520 [Kofleriaceae bacterium]
MRVLCVAILALAGLMAVGGAGCGNRGAEPPVAPAAPPDGGRSTTAPVDAGAPPALEPDAGGPRRCYPYLPAADGSCPTACTNRDQCAGSRGPADLKVNGWPLDCIKGRCVPLPPSHVQGR